MLAVLAWIKCGSLLAFWAYWCWYGFYRKAICVNGNSYCWAVGFIFCHTTKISKVLQTNPARVGGGFGFVVSSYCAEHKTATALLTYIGIAHAAVLHLVNRPCIVKRVLVYFACAGYWLRGIHKKPTVCLSVPVFLLTPLIANKLGALAPWFTMLAFFCCQAVSSTRRRFK